MINPDAPRLVPTEMVERIVSCPFVTEDALLLKFAPYLPPIRPSLPGVAQLFLKCVKDDALISSNGKTL
jgi:hypothetical protein